MSKAFCPTVDRSIEVYGSAPLSVRAEVCGLFHIHQTSVGFAVSPHQSGWKVGTFRNITTARRIARKLGTVSEVNWSGKSADEIFLHADAKRRAWDIVRGERLD